MDTNIHTETGKEVMNSQGKGSDHYFFYTICHVKFIYSENATKFCEIFTVDLTSTTQDKYTVEILQNFVAFSEYLNFNNRNYIKYP